MTLNFAHQKCIDRILDYMANFDDLPYYLKKLKIKKILTMHLKRKQNTEKFYDDFYNLEFSVCEDRDKNIVCQLCKTKINNRYLLYLVPGCLNVEIEYKSCCTWLPVCLYHNHRSLALRRTWFKQPCGNKYIT